MERIGRKLYISFGNSVVAIEKINGITPEQLGLSNENPLQLYDLIKTKRGVKEVQLKDAPAYSVFGADMNRYMYTPEFWLTKEECTTKRDSSEPLEQITQIIDREHSTKEKLNRLFIAIDKQDWETVFLLHNELKEQLGVFEPELVKADVLIKRKKSVNNKK